MKILFTILFLFSLCNTFCWGDYLNEDYLVVHDANSNIFRQVSLDDNSKTVDIKRKSNDTDIYKIIIEQTKDYLKLIYLDSRFYLGILNISNGISTEHLINLSDDIIFDYDKDPKQDVIYFAAKGLFRRELSNAAKEKMIPDEKAVASTFYSDTEGILYYVYCPSRGSLNRINVKDKNVLEPIKLDRCLEHLHIDLKTKQIYGSLGAYIYVALLETGQTNILREGEDGENLVGLAVSSKYLFYVLKGQNIVKRIDRNTKMIDNFYEFPGGNLQAIGLFEGFSKISDAEHLNLNFVLMILSTFVVIVNQIA